MINLRILLSLMIIAVPFSSKAQDQLNHEKKIYTSTEGKIFINKTLPVYFKVATSPEDNAPSHLLRSEITSKYSNPMYFDTEGRNTLNSPSAVDTATKKVVEPQSDVVFEMYADGIAPVTNIKPGNVKKHVENKTTYFGSNMKLDFIAVDEVSGVEATYISVNGSVYQEISKALATFDEEKEYNIRFYSVDHVGNREPYKELKFNIDLSAPTTILSILGENKGKVLSSKASIKLSSKDTLSGLSRIIYSINDGAEKVYTAPIPLSVLKDGETKISYYAIDNTGNVENAKVISTSTGNPGDKEDGSTFSFYIDKEAPVVSFEIVGDQFKGKSLFISERSKFQINALDEKSGVDKILYSQNKSTSDQIYSAPFEIQGAGNQIINYAASDFVGNFALAQIQQVFVDKTSPKTVLSFAGNKFYNRDTLFINSNTKLTIASSESGSGIQKIFYILDGKDKETYSIPIMVKEDGFHTLEYFATDNVNNVEIQNKSSFIVDNNPPEIHYNFSVKAIGEKTIDGKSYTIYPSNTMLYIAATDNASGGERIEYRINGKQVQSVIPLKGFMPGNYEIEINALDVLKNKATEVLRFSIED